MRGALEGQHITVVSAKGRKSEIALTTLTDPNWIIGLRNANTTEGSPSLIESIVNGVARSVSKRPKQFNLPTFDRQSQNARSLHSFEKVEEPGFTDFLQLPLETRTWEILSSKKLHTADYLDEIAGLTFLQLFSQLDDIRATIDIVVTAQSWYLGEQNGRPIFHAPNCPSSLNEVIELVGVRTLRHCGIDPSSVTYEPKIGVVIADRLGLLRLKPRTLEECATELGLTRERVRQICTRVKWTPSRRRWPQPQFLLDLCMSSGTNQRMAHPGSVTAPEDNNYDSNIGSLTARDIANVLVTLGSRRRDVDSTEASTRNLRTIGVTRTELQRRAYKFTERLGFITRAELTKHLMNEFPEVAANVTEGVSEGQQTETVEVEDLLSDLITEVCLPYRFSHDYLYVCGHRGSYFSNWVESLLGCLGPLPFEEIYLATQRFCVVQIPRIAFPPRVIVREFLRQSPDFVFEDDVATLSSGESGELQGRQKWMYDQISSCTGRVIHRAKLFELARQSGVPFGTITVYSSYSLYFKPVGHNCVTITGNSPSDAAIELARDIGAAISVSTETRQWRVEGPRVIVEVSVGTDISHSGVWSPRVNIRNLISGRKYKVLVENSQHGHANWSGNLLAGFVTGLQALGAKIGDSVQMSFDTNDDELELSFTTAE